MFKKIKYMVLCVSGRAGSDFFHALLDNHEEISQLPGCIYFDEIYEKVKNKPDANHIMDIIFKNYSFLFNSKLSGSECHDKLGKNKSQSYKVNIKKFKKIFCKNFKEISYFSFENLINLIHYSYYVASNKKITKIKYILLNLHHYQRIKKLPYFDFRLVYMYRHPVALINSAVKSKIFTYQGSLFTPRSLLWYLNRAIFEIRTLKNFNYNPIIIKLEDLHKDNKFLLNKFCKTLGIKYKKSMLEPTFHGKKWWGDKFSGNKLTGIDKNFKNKINLKFFYKRDIEIIEYLTSDILKKYKYNFFSSYKFNFYNFFLPLKIEIFVLKFFLNKFKFKQILSFPFFYILRIIYFLKFLIYKKLKKNNFKLNYLKK